MPVQVIEGTEFRPLKIDGKFVLPDDLLLASTDLGLSEVYHVSSDVRYLYIHQGEIAINVSTLDFDVIGSDDATSCHIVVLKYSSNKLILTHLDSPDKIPSLQGALHRCIPENHSVVELFVSGGVDDDQSQKLSNALLEMLDAMPHLFSLKIFNTCEINSISHGDYFRPRVTGFGYVSSFGVLPMHFPDLLRKPQFELRNAMLWNNFDVPLTTVFDGDDGLFKIKYFESIFPLEIAQTLLSLSNIDLLSSTSTTPHCESARFTTDVRALLHLLSNRDEIVSKFTCSSGSSACIKEYLCYRMICMEPESGPRWQLVEEID